MSDEGHVAAVVAEADRWLESHRKSETWSTMNRLRDTLVRVSSQSKRSSDARASGYSDGHDDGYAEGWQVGYNSGREGAFSDMERWEQGIE